jgi:hypothetical protein
LLGTWLVEILIAAERDEEMDERAFGG